MTLPLLIIFYISIFGRLTDSITPMCQTSQIGYSVTLTCINVTEDIYEKWYYKSPCPYWDNFHEKIINITNSNLHTITQNFTLLIAKCDLNAIEITNSQIKIINKDAFLPFSPFLHNVKIKINLSSNKIDNLEFLSNEYLTYNSIERFKNLNLNNNKLIAITANNFIAVRYLRTLSIGFNVLKTIGNSTYELYYLEELNLNDNKLSEIEYSVFFELGRLEILNLANNYIEFLDHRLSEKLISLRILNFSGNQIKVLKYDSFSYNFDRGSIFNLYLQNNPLSLLTNQTSLDFQDRLLKLDLSRCNVLVLENIFRDIKSLKSLKLTDSPLTKITPNAFSSLSMLNELDLSNNKLTTLDEFTFTGLKSLTTLYLTNNPINVIFQAFSQFTNLLTLNISVVHFDITNNTFYNLESVHEINFINTSILKISNGAFSNIYELKILRLDNTAVKEISTNAFRDLSFELKENYAGSNIIKLGNNFLTTLESKIFFGISNVNDLELDNNSIENIFPGCFQDVIMATGQSKINLSNNNLIHISNDTFLGITHLKTLLISNNKLTTIEINAFRYLNDLELLDLSQNNLQVLNHKTFSPLTQLKTLNLTQNKLSNLSSNLFVSLVNLKILVLSNNGIKEFPLGTFNNLSSLTELHLKNNKISEFQFGSFSNLGRMTFLDLSNNNLMILNEIVLYPLHNLQLLNLDNNHLSDINYTSLLLHLPRIQFVSVNNNNWNCHFLTNMLKKFSSRRIDYLFNKTENYTVENVDGIPCHQNVQKTEEENYTFKTSSTMHDNNFDTNKEVNIGRKHENFVLVDFQQLINSLNNSKTVNNYFNSTSYNNSTNYAISTTNFLIFFACIGLLFLQIFSLYKKYYSRAKKNCEEPQ